MVDIHSIAITFFSINYRKHKERMSCLLHILDLIRGFDINHHRPHTLKLLDLAMEYEEAKKYYDAEKL